MLRMILATLGAMMIAVPALADSDMPQHPREYPCTWVHGRYIFANGSGIRRIWIIGTHRIVHMWDEDDTPMPAALTRYDHSIVDRLLQNDDAFLFGNFLICPLERDRPGFSRHMRIRGARHLIWNGKPYH